MDSLQSIPLPPASTIPLPQDNEPKLVITSSTSGERSVSTVSGEKDGDSGKIHKEKKKHKKEKKHKHKHKSKDKSKEKKKDHPLITPEVLSQHATAIKAAMLKEVQNDSSNAELSQTIVDDLFKDFLASKMNEIESAYKEAAQKKAASGDVANSVEEMNKLLDDELDTINANTPSPAKKSAAMKKSSSHDKSSKESDIVSHDSKQLQSLVKVSPDTKTVKSLVTAKTRDILPSSVKQTQDNSNSKKEDLKTKIESEATLKSDTNLNSVVNTSVNTNEKSILKDSSEKQEEIDKQVPLESKKPGKLQLAFKISQTSAELILSGSKVDDIPMPTDKKKTLEEGEVLSSGHASSSDSDSENNDEGNEDEEDADISETGSLSDSDKDTKDKSKKKKKKKKHKKKKKKHKISKDKEKDIENKNKRNRSRSRSRSPKRSKRSRTPSGEKRRRSRSPEHGIWRDKKKRDRSKSFSPEHGVWRSSKHKHDRDRSREKERDQKHDYDKDRDYDRHRKHDRDHDHDRKYDKDYDRDRDRDRRRSREREYEKRDSERRYGKWRSRSRSRERKKEKSRDSDDLRLTIDKAKLREIAMKNALAMAKSGQGTIPGVDFATIKAGGKSIDELTEFCARIAAKEKLKKRPAGLTSSSSSDEDGKKSDDDDALIHHPFKVTEKSITMNIRNATPLPVLNAQEKITQQAKLRMDFPVSSGNVHRTKELEWVPVEKTETVKTSAIPSAANAVALPSSVPAGTSSVTTPALPAVATEVKLMPVKDEDKVFVETPVTEAPVDISSIISERIKAARMLAENPKDRIAITAMQKAEHKASLWANSKNLPGKFIGSTGAQILSQTELMGPDKKRQAWAKKAIADVTRYRKYRKKFSTDIVKKLVLRSLSIIDMKDQFNRAAPVKGGIGMALLQKMGWTQGKGLGKNNEGKLEPLALDFKMDRKGLTSQDEHRPSKKINMAGAPLRKDLSGKHPVSALVELCNKRRWGSPDFQLVHEGGPDHKKNFLYRVIVNGVEYQPSSASQNKKTAKSQAATAVLQEMGLVPRD